MNESQHYLRSGLVLYESQQTKIETLLTDMFRQIPAEFILLADVTGQIVSSRGSKNPKNLVALGSLVAGDLAASHEIARLTGQYESHQMVLREGETINTFICEAGDFLALLIQTSTDTPLGWARMSITKSIRELAEIASTPPPNQKEATPTPEFEFDEVDLDLLNDDLDDLWMEE